MQGRMRERAEDISQARVSQRGNGAMGIRTPDLLNAIEALYQLSYDPLN